VYPDRENHWSINCITYSVSNGSSFGPGRFYRSAWQRPYLVFATGLGNPPVVRVLTCGSVRFGSRTGQKPEPLWCWRVVTRPGHRTAGIWPGWNQTAVPNIRFVQLWLKLSISVLIVSRHDWYVNCAVLAPLLPPAFRFAIGLIFVEWL
jgi:hypothetical protein